MSKRIQTGIEGLDTILCGGFIRHNSILLKGAPGTGKTMLGTQVLLNGIEQHGENGVICSFEQFPQQLFRDMQEFGWDLQKLSDEKKIAVTFLKPEDLITTSGQAQTPLMSRLFSLVEERGVKRMLIDSVTHFNRVNPDPVVCRGILLDFINAVKSMGVTPFLTAELGSTLSREYSFEEYLVDEVVLLHNDQAGSMASLPRRSMEVVKSRGHDHVRGRHPFRITPEGIRVFPHILPAPFASDEKTGIDLQPLNTGVAGLDRLMGGGYLRGTATIIAGMSGTFKTTLAASFLAEGARQGEKGLLITFQETPRMLERMQQGQGVDLAGGVASGHIRIAHHVPRETCLDEIFNNLSRELASGELKRVVIDSVNDFERAIDSPEAVKDYLAIFLSALARSGATTLLTEKLDQVSSTNPIADIRFTSMVDAVVYLGNVEIESQILKVVSVLKSRGARVASDLCQIRCGNEGLHVERKFNGLSGILQGSARGQYKETVENIFQPLYFIRDFAQMGAPAGAEPEKMGKILADIAAQADALGRALEDHFGFDPEEAKRI